MELNLNKLLSVVGFACLSTALAADTTTLTKYGHDQGALSLNSESAGIGLVAEYLLWDVRQDGLEVAYTTASTGTEGRIFEPKFDPRSGFRVGAVMSFAETQGVDVALSYIWLSRENHTVTQSGLTNARAAIASSVGGAPLDISAFGADWGLNYNLVDFTFGRRCGFGQGALVLRPFWGLRGAWHTQHLQVQYTPSVAGAQETVSYEHKVCGVGLTAGSEYEWRFYGDSSGGFSIIGVGSLSGIYGNTKVAKQYLQGATSTLDLESQQRRTIPALDLNLGLSWTALFGGDQDNDYGVNLHAVWSLQHWVGMGKFFVGEPNGNSAQDMGLQGLTAGAAFWF